jgi:Ferritin-like
MARVAVGVQWHRPPAAEAAGPLGMAGSEAAEGGPRGERLRLLRKAIAEVGIPVVQATTAREWAITLLQLASEIEHALMVQYLYASVSVPDKTGADGVNYRVKLRGIAIQEMGHLATVLNLLVLVGGSETVHLQRDVQRAASDLNAIPFALEPVTRTALAKFVAAERPLEVSEADRELVDDLVRLAEADIQGAARRVGVVYELLLYLFRDPAQPLPSIDFGKLAPMPAKSHLTEADLQNPSILDLHQATPGEWEVFEEDILLFVPRDCASAREALTAVANQGEGLLEAEEQSHFEQFLETVRAFDLGHVPEGTIAVSPTLGQHGPAGGTLIDHPYTSLWGTVFHLQYTLVVMSIQDSYRSPRPADGSPGLRGRLSSDAVKRMRRVIDEIGNLLTTLPLNATGTLLAGPPYDLDPDSLDQPQASLHASHLALLDQLEALYQSIEAAADLATHAGHAGVITNLRKVDRAHRKLFEPAP